MKFKRGCRPKRRAADDPGGGNMDRLAIGVLLVAVLCGAGGCVERPAAGGKDAQPPDSSGVDSALLLDAEINRDRAA